MTYAGLALTYGAPATYSAPMAGQPTYTISPERFQLILQGQPLTAEEIAAMTVQAAAPVGTSAAVPVGTMGGQSFVMPDMFSTPGLTNVYAATGQAAPVVPGVSTVVEPVAETTAPAPAAPAASAKKEKKSSKKSSKKKLSSKKKEKGCC